MVIALERWPADGVPDNPGAWLMPSAKRRAIDQLRRAKLAERTHEELGHDSEPQSMCDPDDDIDDDLLRLVASRKQRTSRRRPISTGVAKRSR
jgi:RNA polymerase sigma-70 factor, ECF subfamily